MRRFIVLAGLLAASQAPGQDKPISKEDFERFLRRVTKECEIASAIALPRIPGLEITLVTSTPPQEEKPTEAYKPRPWTYSTTVSIKAKALGREETFKGLCLFNTESGAKPNINPEF